MKAVRVLKAISDGLLVLAFVFAGVALLGPSWAWYAAAFCLLDSVVATTWRRRALKAARAS